MLSQLGLNCNKSGKIEPSNRSEVICFFPSAGDEHHEDGAGRQRHERGGDPGQGSAVDESLREGGYGQHCGVQAVVEAEK